MRSPFPLPLTPLERFFYLDDQPGYPNHIICRLRFTGRLNRDRFAKAFEQWGRRHPMLTAQIDSGRRRPTWVAGDHELPDLQWLSVRDEDRDFPPLPPLNLHEGHTARVLIVERSADTDIVMQTHHAAMDGVGGMQATQDLLVLYAAQFSSDHDNRRTIHRVDPMRLTERNRHFSSWWEVVRQLPQQSIGLYGSIKYWLRRAIPLAEMQSVPPQDTPTQTPRLATHLFSSEESEQLRKLAQVNKATVNDVLIRDLLLAMRKWQDDRGVQRGRRVFRIMIPINLRTIADRRLGAANRVSMIYLDRADREMERPKELLWGINFEMQTILRFNLSLMFLAMIRLMSWIPGMLKRQVTSPVCGSTCILTNLGEPFARSRFPRDEQGRAIVGDVTLQGLDMLAPLRPLTAAAFSIFRYCGRTGITLHYDAYSLQANEAEALLSRYVNRIRHSLRRAMQQQQQQAAPSNPQPLS